LYISRLPSNAPFFNDWAALTIIQKLFPAAGPRFSIEGVAASAVAVPRQQAGIRV